MSLKAAITLLEYHNEWRRGAEIEPLNPKDIGIAIDTIIKHYETNT